MTESLADKHCVPCHGGVSHNEGESITREWAAAGLLVLADAVLAAANDPEFP